MKRKQEAIPSQEISGWFVKIEEDPTQLIVIHKYRQTNKCLSVYQSDTYTFIYLFTHKICMS